MAHHAIPPAPHSPGPWTFDPVTLDVGDARGNSVAGIRLDEDLPTDDEPLTRANGALIAAAPPLLAACCAALRDCEDALSGRWEPSREGFQTTAAVLQAAIALALAQ